MKPFGILCVAAASILVGCAAEETADSTRADNEFVVPGYPPVTFRSEVASTITDPAMREAAVFAVETAGLRRNAVLNQADADEYLARTRSIDAEILRDERASRRPQTGSETFVAVRAVPAPEALVKVVVCRYFTPGVYVSVGGELQPESPGREYDADVLYVRTTTAADSAGNESDQDRMLVISTSVATAEYCKPYLPDPFVVAPPEQLPGPR